MNGGRESERRWPTWLAGVGVGLCALAVTLPPVSVLGGSALLAGGSFVWLAAAARPHG